MFKELIDEIGYNNILEYCENANLQNGIYIKINNDGNIINENIIEVEKNKKDIENIELINWFKKRNCYSNYIDSNKAIVQVKKGRKTAKFITSCNYYTVFFNVSTLIKNAEVKKMTIEKYMEYAIDEYFDIFLDIKENLDKLESIFDSEEIKLYIKKNKIKKDLLINKFIKYEYILLQDKNRIQNIKKIKNILLKNIDIVKNKVEDINNIKNKKIKIFMDDIIENYKKEYMLYLKPRVFLNNKNNIISDDTIYGLSSELFALNSKKPLLKTNANLINIPCLISIKEAIKYRNLILYLKGNLSKTRKLGYDSVFDKDGINSFDIIPFNNKDRLVIEPLIIKDYFNKKFDIIEINNKKSLENSFNYYLNGNLYSNKITNNKIKSFVMMYKDIISNYIYKNIENDFLYVLPKILNQLLTVNLNSKNDTFNIIRCFNFKLSLLEYFKNNKKGEIIMNLNNNLKERLDSINNFTINDKEEFLYMCGQLGYYLNSRSKTSFENKKMMLVNTYINCNNIELLKMKLQQDISKYSYDIQFNNDKFKKIIEQILLFKYDNSIISLSEKDYLLAGLFANNLIYYKKKNNNNTEVDNYENE